MTVTVRIIIRERRRVLSFKKCSLYILLCYIGFQIPITRVHSIRHFLRTYLPCYTRITCTRFFLNQLMIYSVLDNIPPHLITRYQSNVKFNLDKLMFSCKQKRRYNLKYFRNCSQLSITNRNLFEKYSS